MGAVKTYKLKDVKLSICGVPIRAYGSTDGLITINMPKFFDSVDGAHGDSISFETGDTTATFTLKLMGASPYIQTLVGIVNTDRRTPGGAGVGSFQLEDISTGEKITGKSRLDGYPTEVSKAPAPSMYNFEGKIFQVEMSFRLRVPVI